MYKVFVNEKKLSISKYPEDVEKKFQYENFATLEIAIDLLENTSCPELNIYGDNLLQIWEDFSKLYQRITLFNHIWEFLMRDVVTHAEQFLSKAQDKPTFKLAAQQQIEAVYYYCSQWFHKISLLYRQEIFLLRLISSGHNAQNLIRKVDLSDPYFLTVTLLQFCEIYQV